MSVSTQHAAIWAVAGLATTGVILRPWKVPEAIWAMVGAVALVVLGLLPAIDALSAIAKGLDVYLFLTGMMLLAELARREGLFDFLAALAVRFASESAGRLFLLVYAIGTVVTIFMSNDATAVVLTPAVYAVAKKAGAKPLTYLFACAFIANAASFVLPISNPANLVVFGNHLPRLADWVRQFALPSFVSIGVTFLVLRLFYRTELVGAIACGEQSLPLSRTGRITAVGIVAVVGAMLTASASETPLGLPALATTALVALIVCVTKKESPRALLQGISWSVLLLVAGLFVLVKALEQTGLITALVDLLRAAARISQTGATWAASAAVAVACNLVNNLPAGLIAGAVLTNFEAAPRLQTAVTIGVDLGPNLSVTGSLATILCLIAIRREGENVAAWQFLRVGAIAMPAALLLALAVLII